MRSTIGSFGPFSQPSVWDQSPLRHSSATHSAQMQQCRECSSGGSEVLVARLQVAASARRHGRSAEPLNQISISVGSAAVGLKATAASLRSVPWCWRLPPVALLLNVPTGPEERTWLTSATSTTARPRSGRPSYQDLTRRADRACQPPVPDRTTRSAEHCGFC